MRGPYYERVRQSHRQDPNPERPARDELAAVAGHSVQTCERHVVVEGALGTAREHCRRDAAAA